jgi:hypothetical protein
MNFPVSLGMGNQPQQCERKEKYPYPPIYYACTEHFLFRTVTDLMFFLFLLVLDCFTKRHKMEGNRSGRCFGTQTSENAVSKGHVGSSSGSLSGIRFRAQIYL